MSSGVDMMASEWLSVEDIANDLKVTIDTVRAWIRRKQLPAYRVGRDYRIKRADYNKFLEARYTLSDDSELTEE
jgi:excisionase family DNA binding protein